ncbi:MAG TPA: hypothetical protein VJB02_06645 [Coxiellaceae bacterium]|nr:hypothetical protein [Coxiellaceae bacterium]
MPDRTPRPKSQDISLESPIGEGKAYLPKPTPEEEDRLQREADERMQRLFDARVTRLRKEVRIEIPPEIESSLHKGFEAFKLAWIERINNNYFRSPRDHDLLFNRLDKEYGALITQLASSFPSVSERDIKYVGATQCFSHLQAALATRARSQIRTTRRTGTGLAVGGTGLIGGMGGGAKYTLKQTAKNHARHLLLTTGVPGLAVAFVLVIVGMSLYCYSQKQITTADVEKKPPRTPPSSGLTSAKPGLN